MAVKEQEQADVNIAGRKLKSEVAKWTTYNEAVEMWRSKTELQKRVLLTGRDQKNQKLINDECDRRLPVRDVQCPEHLGTCVCVCPGLGRGEVCPSGGALAHLLD